LAVGSAESERAPATLVDESLEEIAASDLVPRGKELARRIVRELRVYRDHEEYVLPTQDEGLTLEFTSATRGKELLFAIPQDGSRIFFSVCGPGVRKGGIVRDERAVRRLSEWMETPQSELPAEGLDFG
jgi:hypothetical protein